MGKEVKANRSSSMISGNEEERPAKINYSHHHGRDFVKPEDSLFSLIISMS